MMKMKSLLCFYLCFCCFPAISNDWNINLPNGRPSVPYPILNNYNVDLTESGIGPSFTVPVSRHHIIPYNLIRDFYNEVIKNNRRQRIIGGFFKNMGILIGVYAGTQGVLCNDAVMSSLEQAADLSYMIAAGQISNSEHAVSRPDGYDYMVEYFAWLPGNLFIGPTLRADDPGENFEEDSVYIIGSERYRILRDLRNQMEAYLELSALPEHVTLPYLRRIVVLLADMSRTRRIKQMSPTNWRRRSDGKYEIIKNNWGNVANIKSKLTYESDKSNDTFNKGVDPLALRCLTIKPHHKIVVTQIKGRPKDEL